MFPNRNLSIYFYLIIITSFTGLRWNKNEKKTHPPVYCIDEYTTK